MPTTEQLLQVLQTVIDPNTGLPVLSPNGLAYISYNTLPGWHMQGALREMMLYHTAGFSSHKERIDQAKALLQFLAGHRGERMPIRDRLAVGGKVGPYARALP